MVEGTHHTLAKWPEFSCYDAHCLRVSHRQWASQSLKRNLYSDTPCTTVNGNFTEERQPLSGVRAIQCGGSRLTCFVDALAGERSRSSAAFPRSETASSCKR